MTHIITITIKVECLLISKKKFTYQRGKSLQFDQQYSSPPPPACEWSPEQCLCCLSKYTFYGCKNMICNACQNIILILNSLSPLLSSCYYSLLQKAKVLDFDFLQSFTYSLRMRKLPNFLCWILSGRAIALKMCQSIVKKCHKCLKNMFLVSDSPTLHKNVVNKPTFL